MRPYSKIVKRKMTEEDKSLDVDEQKKIAKDEDMLEWMIRPCNVYQEEYTICTSKEGRKHQKYTLGFELDCSQWLEDAENCEKLYVGNDQDAMRKIIEHEKERRHKRLEKSLNNNVWEYRDSPPADWNQPIPGWEEKTKDSFFHMKNTKTPQTSSCVIS